MAKSKATNKSTLEHEISRYYKGHPFSYYSLSSNCPSEEEIKKLIEEIDTDRPKEEDDKRVKLLRTYLGKCVACYVYHIFHSTKDVREEVCEEINRANKKAFKSFNKDRNLDKFLERLKLPVDPLLSKDFAKLLDIMDAMCVVLEQSIIRLKDGNNLSIDSLQRIDTFWASVGENEARASETLIPQLQRIYKDVFPGQEGGKDAETPGSGKEKTLVSLEDVVQGGVKPEQFKKMRKMLEDAVEKQTRERSMELGEMFREQDRELRERLKGIAGKRGPLEQATETPPQQGQGEGKDIKKFFRNHWQWLIGASIGFIGMIFGILQFLVMKK